ncbi:SUMO-interacting motif-containing protein 1 [Osmerus mordax]|uniref:SUMO-interacting motif-containing protein 1 n=1 Tax=Osmerus mordax TaxID=8014 RepID=UPI00350F4DAB
MADIILLSSASEEDSDIEVVGVYSDTERKTETIPFIRGEWINLAAYAPFVFDLTAHGWALPPPRRRRRRNPSAPVEVVDLSDESGLEDEAERSLSPLSQGGKGLKRFSNKSQTQRRVSDSPDCSPKEQHPGCPPALQEGQDNDILELQQQSLILRNTFTVQTDGDIEISSDRDIPDDNVKSPSVPASKLTEEVTALSDPVTKESQQLPAILLDEEKELPGYPNSDTVTMSTDGSQPEQRPAVENEDAQPLMTVGWNYHTEGPETRAESPPSPPPGDSTSPALPLNQPDSTSPALPLNQPDSTSPVLPQNQPYSPSQSPEKVDFVDYCDFAIHDSLEMEPYSPTHSPYEWSPSSSPHASLKDGTSCLGQEGMEERWYRESISPQHHTGAQPLVSQPQEAIPSDVSKPCSTSPSLEPENDSPLLPPQPPQMSPLLHQPHQSPSLQTSQSDSLKSRSELPLSPSSVALPARGFPDQEPLQEQPPEVLLVGSDLSAPSHPASSYSIPSDPPMSVTNTEDLEQDPGPWRPPRGGPGDRSGLWLEGSDEEAVRGREVADMGVSEEDRQYVCPVQLRKFRPLMAGPLQSLENVEEEDDGFGAPEQLCRQGLSLVYSTMEESYPEGTLQLLSDLLHPRFYPPRDITTHLLRDILLDPRAPRSLRFQAFSLLMRTQRHHPAEKGTIPWDWELLTSVMTEQDSPKRHSSEAVCMLLQYTLQTLEDDFRVKLSQRDLPHSIAKATLSCDSGRVSDVISWLLTSIVKSTGVSDAKERDDHLKMVLLLQKMLVLSLEVDCCPGVSANKLAQRLVHSCSSTLRQHRMLLLETLESRLLRCRLLEQMLEQACPHTTSLPMSLALLLHFLKHCTLTPDPTDGADRELGWEELVQLLWMLLLSHEEVVKGHLHCPVTERAGNARPPVQVVTNTVSRSDVQGAVEDFLLRSQADLGRTLPLHVHESLTYLQDHMMDSCQC